MAKDPIALGAFDLGTRVGTSGRSTVWHAMHRASGQRAAVELSEVPTSEVGAAQRFRARFTHDVQATAALDHPRIVRLHAHGEAPEAVAAALGLAVGTPFLVRAWVAGSSFEAMASGVGSDGSGGSTALQGWPGIRGALLALLDALAHAHARGVVHGALGPRQVVWSGEGPVLIGFPPSGSGDERAEDRAPEQWRGEVAGPGADLYALGCLAYRLLCKQPIFAGASGAARRELHLTTAPVIALGLAAPAEVVGWLGRLLAKAPADRFRFAADAAIALRALPGPVDAGVMYTLPAADDVGWAAGAGSDGRPPLPAELRERAVGPLFALVDTGAALQKLRPARTAGRETERAWLWSALANVVRGEGLHAVGIEGASGMGKSHLAVWLGLRAAELGLAVAMRANHAAGGGATMGVGPMLARHLRCAGVDAATRAGFAGAAGFEGAAFEEAAALAAALDPGGRGDEGRARVVFDRPDERYAALAAALARLVVDRPLLIHLDDVHWGEDALRFALYLLRRRPELPALIVATAGRMRWRRVRRWGRFGGSSCTRNGSIRSGWGRCRRRGRRRRCRRWCGGRRRWWRRWRRARRAVRCWRRRRCGCGSRRGRWSSRRRGRCCGGRRRCRRGSRRCGCRGWITRWPLPSRGRSRRWSWRRRWVRRWIARRGRWRVGWRGCRGPSLGITRLHAERLLRAESGGRWRFVHPALLDAVARRARAQGRWVAWHGHAADAVASRPAPDLHRLATHLAAAGRFAAAAEALVGAFEAATGRADQSAARQALVQRAQMLGALDVPLDAGPWVANRVLRARLARRFGRMEVALRSARRAEPQARAVGDPALHAEALIELGTATRMVEGEVKAWPILSAAIDRAMQAGDRGIEGRARFVGASCLTLLGRFDEAWQQLTASLAAAEAVSDHRTQGDALVGLADLARRRGELAAAEKAVSEAYLHYQQAGHRTGRAVVASLLGDLARYAGDLDGAWRHYTESLALYAAVDSVDVPTAECNLALVELARGQAAEAQVRLLRAERMVWGGHELRVIIHAVLLACAGALGDWAAWDVHMAAVGPLFEGRLAEPDAAAAAVEAAARAEAAGETARAADARRLAVVQYETLGRRDEAAAIGRLAREGAAAALSARIDRLVRAPAPPRTRPSRPRPPTARRRGRSSGTRSNSGCSTRCRRRGRRAGAGR
jgi:tetratricopeptide (TPR) repeat protein